MRSDWKGPLVAELNRYYERRGENVLRQVLPCILADFGKTAKEKQFNIPFKEDYRVDAGEVILTLFGVKTDKKTCLVHTVAVNGVKIKTDIKIDL